MAFHRLVLSDWEGAWQCVLIQSDTGLSLKFNEIISMTIAHPTPFHKEKNYITSRGSGEWTYLKDSFVTIGRVFEVWGQTSGWE